MAPPELHTTADVREYFEELLKDTIDTDDSALTETLINTLSALKQSWSILRDRIDAVRHLEEHNTLADVLSALLPMMRVVSEATFAALGAVALSAQDTLYVERRIRELDL